ncbi:MAG: hypothetical protein EBS28_02070 [Chlamydiae bacterium]|nr:hypothetical protein [Chlamydiota bacterium]
MSPIEEFFSLYFHEKENHVWVLTKEKTFRSFSGKNGVFSAVCFMNKELKNFRLNGVTLFCVLEPTLKEMGLLLLSRVDKVIFLKKTHLQDLSFLDRFLVHKLEREHYADK